MNRFLPFLKKSARALLLLLWVSLLSAGAFAQGPVTLQMNNATVREVLSALEKQSGFTFLYSVSLFKDSDRINVDARAKDFYQLLDEILTPRQLTYKVDDKVVVISQKAVSYKVSGAVYDSQGVPLVGATIIMKGSNRGAISGRDGSFTLNIPQPNATLSVSYMGMKTKEVGVSDQQFVNVRLENASQSIDEITVTGAYGGIQKKADMVGSAYQVNSDKLETLPAARVDAMLEGLVPGMRVAPMEDYAVSRSRYNVRIRGDASLSAGREPLWVIDGTPMYTGDRTNMITGMSYSVSPLSFLDPNDIESITVLKDAVETAIYGSNGSNGIVLITTKKGSMKDRDGSPRVKASFTYGVGLMDRSTEFKVLNSEQYLMLAKEAWANAGNDMRAFPYQDSDMNHYSTTNTDWYDVFFGDAARNIQAQVSISGGTEKMSNYLSMSYYRDVPIVKGNLQERLSTRFTTDYQINKKLSLNFRTGLSYNTNDLFSTDHSYYEYLPVFSPYYENSNEPRLYNWVWEEVILNYNGDKSDYNPYTGQRITQDQDGTVVYWPYQQKFFNKVAYRDENTIRQIALKADANIVLSYKIINGLSFTAQLGADYLNNSEYIYKAQTNWEGLLSTRPAQNEDPNRDFITTPNGKASRGQAMNLTWINGERVNFNRVFNEKHNVSAMVGFEIYSRESNYVSASGSGFPNDMMKEVSYAVTGSKTGSGNSDIQRKMSFFGQARYTFDSRYSVTVNYRRDGNSDFGEYARWSNFSSAGVAWNMHNEKFYNIPWLTTLKLKGSFGSAGNSVMQNYLSAGSYSTSDSYSYMGELGATMGSPPTSGLTWETVYKTNLGLDLSLFRRVDIGIEVYNNHTKDMISSLPVSRTIGDREMYRNVGELRNRGIEVTINSKNMQMKDFSWDTEFIISHNRNKILKMYNSIPVSFSSYGWYEGQDINVWTLIRWAGVDPRDGEPLWYDKNGNITKSYSYDNRVPYKTKTPTVEGSLTNSFRWKDFDLGIRVFYAIGGWGHSSAAVRTMTDGRDIISANQAIEMLDRWQRPGDLALNPRNTYVTGRYTTSYNTRLLYNKTHFKLSSVTLSYRVPRDFNRKLGISESRLTFIGDNLALWAPRDNKNHNSYKTLMSGYPSQRNFSLRLEVVF